MTIRAFARERIGNGGCEHETGRYPDQLSLTGLRLGSGTILVLVALASTCRSTAATGATAALFHSAGLRLGSGTIVVLLARAGAAAGRAGTVATRAGSAAARAGSAAACAASPSAGSWFLREQNSQLPSSPLRHTRETRP